MNFKPEQDRLLRGRGQHSGYSGDIGFLALAFLELPKTGGIVSSNMKHWLDFFQGRTICKSAPEYIHQAYALSKEQNLSAKEASLMKEIDIAEEDRKDQLHYAWNEGMQKGHKEGLEKGIEKGFTAGRDEAAAQIAKNLFNRQYPLEDICEITGLDEQALKSLQEG